MDASRRPWVPLIAVALGYFMVILDATAVNLALPAISRDLGGGVTGLQWVLDGYTLAFAALPLSAGVAGDRLGPRRVFLAGLALFTVASAGCALASSIWRADRHPAGPGHGRRAARAYLADAAAGQLPRPGHAGPGGRPAGRHRWPGRRVGPVLGGALTTAVSWRLVLAVNIPVGVFAWWLTRRRVADPVGARDRRGDPAGQLTAIVALTALTGGLIEAGPHGWASWPVAAGLLIAVLAAAAFVTAQRRVRSPMLPPRLLRRPTLSAGSVVGLLINLGFYGQLFAYSLYLQQVRGYSPLIAGLALLPEACTVPVAAVLSGRLTSHGGPRRTMVAGLSLGSAGLFGLLVSGPGTAYWIVVLPMLAAGAGMALTMPAATTAVMDSALASRGGAAAGLLNTARQVGSALGVAVAGSLLASRAGFLPGLHLALAVSGAAFLAGVLVTLAWVDRVRGRRTPAGREPVRAPRAGQPGPVPAPRAGQPGPARQARALRADHDGDPARPAQSVRGYWR